MLRGVFRGWFTRSHTTYSHTFYKWCVHTVIPAPWWRYWERVGFSPVTAGLITSVHHGCSALGSLLGGTLGDLAHTRLPGSGRICVAITSVVRGVICGIFYCMYLRFGIFKCIQERFGDFSVFKDVLVIFSVQESDDGLPSCAHRAFPSVCCVGAAAEASSVATSTPEAEA